MLALCGSLSVTRFGVWLAQPAVWWQDLLEGFVVVEDQHVRPVAKDYALMRVGSGGERWFKRVRRGHSPYFWCLNGSSRGEVGYILVEESCQLRPWVLGPGM
jgi:hypothetical protein